ncbi:MAG: hypothetical protein M3R13_01285 [Armatimonadota bacterium]|nr:hypothetical protein [Armatimonadota bacterium]
MFPLFAQTEPPGTNFWSIERTVAPFFSQQAFLFILGAFIATVVLLLLLSRIPSNFRRPLTIAVTFMAGFFYVLEFLWPRSVSAGGVASQVIPGIVDLQEAQGVVNDISQILTGFLLALGVLSIFRVHFGRLFKKQKDWFYSLVLLISLFSIFVLGLITFSGDLRVEQAQATLDAQLAQGGGPVTPELESLARLGVDARANSLTQNLEEPVKRAFNRREIERGEFDTQMADIQTQVVVSRELNDAVVDASVAAGTLNPEFVDLAKGGVAEAHSRSRPVQAYNVMFQRGLLAMDAAMFSLIGFFILSAAYRAFRVRSIEASILMATALVVLLMFVPIALMLTSGLDPDSFAGNFRIDSIGMWLLSTINVPAIRAIDLGLGLGLLAMGLRIMLGLEKGVSAE